MRDDECSDVMRDDERIMGGAVQCSDEGGSVQ